uniref:Uncharacterized protein n=1 Tax=Plectus sambesii TaxID=2011161 RepID=A0A914UW83_9BILA
MPLLENTRAPTETRGSGGDKEKRRNAAAPAGERAWELRCIISAVGDPDSGEGRRAAEGGHSRGYRRTPYTYRPPWCRATSPWTALQPSDSTAAALSVRLTGRVVGGGGGGVWQTTSGGRGSGPWRKTPRPTADYVATGLTILRDEPTEESTIASARTSLDPSSAMRHHLHTPSSVDTLKRR